MFHYFRVKQQGSFNSGSASLLFWLIFFLAIADRIWILIGFGFNFTDSDQVILWMGAKDYARGIFHEPCVYGQNYGYMLESFLAAPLTGLGVAPSYALPLVTGVLAIAPYLSWAVYFRRRNWTAAAVFAAIPICLPPEFGMMTTASHNLVTGIFMAAFFPWLHVIKNLGLRFCMAGFLAAFAVALNPNSLPVMMVLILWMQFQNPRQWRAWIYLIIGAAPCAILAAFAGVYYAKHPPIHSVGPAALAFDASIFLNNLKKLDLHFNWLCPVIWSHGSGVLLGLTGIVLLLIWKHRWAEAVPLAAALMIVIFSLGFPKMEDGTAQVSYAYSRMFLALPLLLAIAFSFCADLVRMPKWIFGIAPVLLAVKISLTGDIVRREANAPGQIVQLSRIDDIRKACGRIDALCHPATHLIVALPPVNCTYPDAAFYCYAGGVMWTDYPPTLIYGFERRSWRVEMESTNRATDILFIGGDQQRWQRAAGPEVVDCGDGTMVIHRVHNTGELGLPELIHRLQPDLR